MIQMKEMQVFKNPEFGEVRTVEVNGEPWLVGKDVALALGYKNPQEAIRTHVEEEDKGVSEILTPGGKQTVPIINESGLYALVLSSKLPGARKFKRWVTAEVLPSIRKHGLYATENTVEAMLNDPDTAIRLLQEVKTERQKRIALEAENEAQRQAIADFEPVRQYVDNILASKETLATTQIAADYDMSAKRLNKILHEEGIQRFVNGQWVLYRKYMGKGYTKSETIHITHRDGKPGTKMVTKWTQKGRMLIHNILTARGIMAVMDRAAAV